MITWTRKISSIIKKINKDLLFENKQNRKLHLKLVETKMNKDDTTFLLNIKCHGISRKATKSAFLEKLTPHIFKGDWKWTKKSKFRSHKYHIVISFDRASQKLGLAYFFFWFRIKKIYATEKESRTLHEIFLNILDEDQR